MHCFMMYIWGDTNKVVLRYRHKCVIPCWNADRARRRDPQKDMSSYDPKNKVGHVKTDKPIGIVLSSSRACCNRWKLTHNTRHRKPAD
jgi:hypothetical protein